MPHTAPDIYGNISTNPTLQLDKENGLVLLLAGATTVAWDVAELGQFIDQLQRYREALRPVVRMEQKVLDFYSAPPEGSNKDAWLPEKTADE